MVFVQRSVQEVPSMQKGGTVMQEQVNNWLNGGLDFIWLEITKKCNLGCVHCYASSSPYLPLLGRMTKEDWKRVLDEGIQLGCRKVQFIGGEPTLHSYLFELIQHAKDVGYEFIEVFTNGTVLNDAKLKMMKDLGVNLAFSVYANNPELHDKITQGKGSFNKTLGNIRKAVELGIPVRVGIIVINGLNSEVVEATTEILKEMGVNNVKTDRVRGIGRGSELNPSPDPFTELCGECWKGKIRIDADGKASPCVFSWFIEVGDAKEQHLEHVAHGPALLEFRQKLLERRNSGLCHPNCPCYPECDPDDTRVDKQLFCHDCKSDMFCDPYEPVCRPDCLPFCGPCAP
jgi:MoaA/NifB/PqqE/SkfB family radical SAM enzyme